MHPKRSKTPEENAYLDSLINEHGAKVEATLAIYWTHIMLSYLKNFFIKHYFKNIYNTDYHQYVKLHFWMRERERDDLSLHNCTCMIIHFIYCAWLDPVL